MGAMAKTGSQILAPQVKVGSDVPPELLGPLSEGEA